VTWVRLLRQDGGSIPPASTREINMDKDITDQVKFYDNDGDCLPLLQCICGREFSPWDFNLGIYRDMPSDCDCGRKLYFRNKITVYEVKE